MPHVTSVLERGRDDLLAAAMDGDERAFAELAEAHRPALHLHCYRLLGSLDDADDATQETLVRAWRALPRFEPRSPLRAWLYRIATNASLRLLQQRGRSRPDRAAPHLQPYPDHLLEQPEPDADPRVAAERREQVGLAFVAAMQLLPPRQRAVLVLRDALGWSARETAEALDLSVAAVTSALQRARARLREERERGTLARIHAPRDRAEEADLMRRFQDAWARADVPGIVALLAPDASLAMPPEGMAFHGREAVGGFFATQPLEGRLDEIALVPARANGQPVLAAYAPEQPGGEPRAYGVMVMAVAGGAIAGITGFPRQAALFTRLGLPLALAR